jgi:hypothetical protein
MKSLSSTLATALGAPVTQPAVLVQIDFSTTQRWSSFATRTWGGHTWHRWPLALRNLVVQAYDLSGQLELDNRDDQAAALVLGEGITDRTITLWGYDAAAASDDVVWLGSALGGRAVIELERVVVDLRHPCDNLLSPRTAVTPGSFGTLLPEAADLVINGQPLQLDRRIA